MSFDINGIIGKVSGGLFKTHTEATTDLCLRRVEPASGPNIGGTALKLYAKDKGEDIVLVLIGGVEAEITSQTDTVVDIISPMGSVGFVDVYAATLTLNDTLENEFEYYSVPTHTDPFYIEVIKTSDNYHYIEWDYTPPDGFTIDDYKFNIYWSISPECDFEAIRDDEGDIVEIDGAIGPLVYTHQLKQYDFNIPHYYKVHAILKTDSVYNSYSEVAFVGMDYDGEHAVIKQAENILNDMFCGEPTYIIKKKATGVRCTNCWSASRQQRTLTHCDVCEGSGFVDGYYCAILVQMADDSGARKSDSQRSFEDVYDSKRSRMSNYPIVRPKDLIVTVGDYKRYVVRHVETTKLPRHATSGTLLSKQNYVVSQLLTLQELNPDDNEYNVDINSILPS